MLKRLEVDNFKSLVKFYVDLGPTCVVIGNNATGKSTILQAIDFLCSSVKEDFNIMLERRGWRVENVKSKLTSSNKIHFRGIIDLGAEEDCLQYQWDMVLNAYTGKNEIQLQSETVKCGEEMLLSYANGKTGFVKGNGVVPAKIDLPDAIMMNSSAMRILKGTEKIDERLRRLIEFLDNSSSFEMLSPGEMRLSSRGNKESIGMSGKNLPSFIKQMNWEQKQHFMKKVDYVLDGRITDVEAKTQGKPGWTQISSIENYNNKSFRVSSKEMSDGMLRLLAFIAISEIQRSEAVMLLDEVENGINANYAEKIMEILKAMFSEKRHQLILTTHSTVFLDYVDAENIIYLYRDENGYTKAEKLFESEEMKKQLEYMWPGEIILNMSQAEILNKLLEG